MQAIADVVDSMLYLLLPPPSLLLFYFLRLCFSFAANVTNIFFSCMSWKIRIIEMDVIISGTCRACQNKETGAGSGDIDEEELSFWWSCLRWDVKPVPGVSRLTVVVLPVKLLSHVELCSCYCWISVVPSCDRNGCYPVLAEFSALSNIFMTLLFFPYCIVYCRLSCACCYRTIENRAESWWIVVLSCSNYWQLKNAINICLRLCWWAH